MLFRSAPSPAPASAIGVVVGSLEAITHLGVGAPTLAYATDTHQLMYDADGDWSGGSLSIGSVTLGDAWGSALSASTVGTSVAVTAAVPEPATWALWGLGIAGLAARRCGSKIDGSAQPTFLALRSVSRCARRGNGAP